MILLRLMHLPLRSSSDTHLIAKTIHPQIHLKDYIAVLRQSFPQTGAHVT